MAISLISCIILVVIRGTGPWITWKTVMLDPDKLLPDNPVIENIPGGEQEQQQEQQGQQQEQQQQ
ncbi:MAG: hypothetical protein R6U46_00845 [Marinilabilia sp.]